MLLLLFLLLLQNFVYIEHNENRPMTVLAIPEITTNAAFTSYLNDAPSNSASSTLRSTDTASTTVDTEPAALTITQNTAPTKEATANAIVGRSSNILKLNPYYSILLPNGFDSQVPPAQPMLYPTLTPLNTNSHLTIHRSTTPAADSMLDNSWLPLWPTTNPINYKISTTTGPTATKLNSNYESFQQQIQHDSTDVRITSVIYGDWKPLLPTMKIEKDDFEDTPSTKDDKKTVINRQNGGFIGQITQKPLAANSNEIQFENLKTNSWEFNREGLLDSFIESPLNYKFRPVIFVESKKNSTNRIQQKEMERKDLKHSNNSTKGIAGDNLVTNLLKGSGGNDENRNNNNSKITLKNIKSYQEIPTRQNSPQDFIENSLSTMLAIRSESESISINNHDNSSVNHREQLQQILNSINVRPAVFWSQLPDNITEIGRPFNSMSTTHESLLCIPIILKVVNKSYTTDERIYCFPPMLMNTAAKETTTLTPLKIQPITQKPAIDSSRPHQQQTKVMNDDDDDDLEMTDDGDDDDDDNDDDSYTYADDDVDRSERVTTSSATTFNCCTIFTILLTFLRSATTGVDARIC